ncbi:ABC transporter permease [Cohnella sp. GCM10027633]|uniref:ABC transporter permease n=1 Tax=unclassified Cohnella TaxID=2636738 RepID=UPI0036437959
MRQWLVLLGKEWLEMVRSFRILWMPISFIVLGASQPIMDYFMKDILANAGNLPEGAIIQIPVPKPFEVMAGALQQYGVIGMLLIALTSMGALSNERSSGTAAMILVKPVSFTSFVMAKWTAILLLATGSFLLGYGAAWYYTYTLFDVVEWQGVLQSGMLFILWIALIGTLTLLFSALLRSAAAAAFCALAAAVVFTTLSGTLPYEQSWNPGRLPGLAAEILNPSVHSVSGGGTGALWLTVLVTVIVIAVGLLITRHSLKRGLSE